jgi:hypothetical protein
LILLVEHEPDTLDVHERLTELERPMSLATSTRRMRRVSPWSTAASLSLKPRTRFDRLADEEVEEALGEVLLLEVDLVDEVELEVDSVLEGVDDTTTGRYVAVGPREV